VHLTSIAFSPAVDRILADLPTDPASVAVLVLLFAAVGAVVWLGRSQAPPE